MKEIICHGCNSEMDIEGIEAFTLCECSLCGARISVPMMIGYLQLEKDLGKISHLHLYEGFDKAQNMNSLIYILETDIEDYREVLELAREDALLLSTLKNPAICPVLNYGIEEDRFFVTEPVMDGYDLGCYIPEKQGLLDIDNVINLIEKVAVALKTAHHKEVCHHNISPECIQIDARSNIRLKNFFLSRFLYMMKQKYSDEALSCSKYFVSPEKVQMGVEEKRGDIYSLGAVFYYLLTGRYPFEGKTDIETIYSRIRKPERKDEEKFNEAEHRLLTPDTVSFQPPPAPHELREDIPVDISALIMKMIAFYPARRPRAGEVVVSIDLVKAQQDRIRVRMAQREMVTTITKAIPVMKHISKDGK